MSLIHFSSFSWWSLGWIICPGYLLWRFYFALISTLQVSIILEKIWGMMPAGFANPNNNTYSTNWKTVIPIYSPATITAFVRHNPPLDVQYLIAASPWKPCSEISIRNHIPFFSRVCYYVLKSKNVWRCEQYRIKNKCPHCLKLDREGHLGVNFMFWIDCRVSNK